MKGLSIAEACEAVAGLCDKCSLQLMIFAELQRMGASQLDAANRQRITTAKACQLARQSLVEIERDLRSQVPFVAAGDGRELVAGPTALPEPVRKPWQLTLSAIGKYRAIVAGGVSEAQARRALNELAQRCTEAKAVPRELDNGAIEYRGGRPLRLRLIVIREGESLRLVDVLPDHEQRRGAKSTAIHRTKKK
jgi:hypothetical protein